MDRIAQNKMVRKIVIEYQGLNHANSSKVVTSEVRSDVSTVTSSRRLAIYVTA